MPISNPIDQGEFRKALGSFTTGVTVVTTRGTEGNDVGLTANSFNSVSLDPPMVLWSLGKSSLSLAHFKAASHFAVHILSQSQEALSATFARRGSDKFAGLDISRGPGGIPLLDECATRFTCRTAYQYEGGDHIIFVGEVVELCHSSRSPLLFHAGQYAQLLQNRSEAAEGDRGDLEAASLGYLLRCCSHQLLRQLKSELVKYGLTVAQYYFLALVARHGQGRLDTFLDQAEHGDNLPSKAEIDDLIRCGYLARQQDEIRLSATGSRLHMELVAFYKASEASALNALDFEMRQTLQIALAKIAQANPAV
ncbi:MAG: flavin reductase [Bacteroidales bacterium]|nr:flavin reductase [Bacteroidales bacterium]